jgi:hypothetical protein
MIHLGKDMEMGGGGVRDEDGQGNEKESQKRLGFHDSKVLKTMGHS